MSMCSKNSKGLTTIEDLKKLKVPVEVMKEGMLFIWTEKELIHEVIKHFESQGFTYVENMVYVMIDETKKEEVEAYNNTDATAAIVRQPYKFIRKSHKTLLMMRRTQANDKK